MIMLYVYDRSHSTVIYDYDTNDDFSMSQAVYEAIHGLEHTCWDDYYQNPSLQLSYMHVYQVNPGDGIHLETETKIIIENGKAMVCL